MTSTTPARPALALAAISLLTACAQKEDASAAPPVGVPSPVTTATAAATSKGGHGVPPEATADPLGAISLPDMRSCMTTCGDDNRMRGVGAEQIESDCRAQCEKTCLGQCEQVNEPQKTRCKQDCERQSESTKLP